MLVPRLLGRGDQNAERACEQNFVQPHLKSDDFKSGCKHEGGLERTCWSAHAFPLSIMYVTRLFEEADMRVVGGVVGRDIGKLQ
jgi:hypothetical protein